MKKLVKIVSAVAVMALSVVLLTGCKVNSTSYNENSTTRNGITRTERTETTNGNTTTSVTYKDANGNELSAEAGEAAFNGTAATEADKDSEPAKVTASLVLQNLSGHPIKGVYMVSNDVDPTDTSKWGENMLNETLENDMQHTWPEVTYQTGVLRQLIVNFADGEGTDITVFDSLNFDTAADPTNLTYLIKVNESGSGYTLDRQ